MPDQKDLEIIELKRSFCKNKAVSSIIWGTIILL